MFAATEMAAVAALAARERRTDNPSVSDPERQSGPDLINAQNKVRTKMSS